MKDYQNMLNRIYMCCTEDLQDKDYKGIQKLVEQHIINKYVVTEYCKTKLVETRIASNLSKKDAHVLRELLNTYADKENKVRYKCYYWSK